MQLRSVPADREPKPLLKQQLECVIKEDYALTPSTAFSVRSVKRAAKSTKGVYSKQLTSSFATADKFSEPVHAMHACKQDAGDTYGEGSTHACVPPRRAWPQPMC